MPTTSFSHILYHRNVMTGVNEYFLHKWRHVHALWRHLLSLPHQFSIFGDLAGGGGRGSWQPQERFDHTYFGAGFEKMENIFMGNSVFWLVPMKHYSSKFGHRMLDSFACLSSIRKIIMTQIYLYAAMRGFHKTGVGMWDHDPCYQTLVDL